MAANRSRTRRPKTDPIKKARAQKTIQNVREHWVRGAKANAEREKHTPRELSERFKVNYHTLRKERRFARHYSEKDLEELLRLRRPNGTPLHWGHVMYLITVPHKKDRRELQKKAAKEGWSSPDLCKVVQQRYPDRVVRGGRPQKIPSTREGGVRLMIEETDRWLRRFNGLWAASERGARTKAAALRELRSKLEEMAHLAESAATQLPKG
jgi:hypothetical protein